MAGEAVSGRYGAARHAVADEGGSPRHPASDDRSLVDRLLASSGGDQEFDWGWGEPSASEPAREPLHDIPELWGPDERTGGPREERFPTPRLQLDGDNRGSDDRGSDDWGAPAPDLDGRGPGDQRFDGRGIDDDPLGVLSNGRVLAEHGPLGDDAGDRSLPPPHPAHDGGMDGEHAGALSGAGRLDRAPDDRSPLAPPLPDGEAPGRGAFDGPGGDEDRTRREPAAAEPAGERKLDSDPRLRRWANLGRPSQTPADPPATLAPPAEPDGGARGADRPLFDDAGAHRDGADSDGPGARFDRPDPAGAPRGPERDGAHGGGPDGAGREPAEPAWGAVWDGREPGGPDRDAEFPGADRGRPRPVGSEWDGPARNGVDGGGRRPVGPGFDPADRDGMTWDGPDRNGAYRGGPGPVGPERDAADRDDDRDVPRPVGSDWDGEDRDDVNRGGPRPLGSDWDGPNGADRGGPRAVGAERDGVELSGADRGPRPVGSDWHGGDRNGPRPVGADRDRADRSGDDSRGPRPVGPDWDGSGGADRGPRPVGSDWDGGDRDGVDRGADRDRADRSGGERGGPRPVGSDWDGPNGADRGTPRPVGPEWDGPSGADRGGPRPVGAERDDVELNGAVRGGPRPVGSDWDGEDRGDVGRGGARPVGPEWDGPSGADRGGPRPIGPEQDGAEWDGPRPAGAEWDAEDRNGVDRGPRPVGPAWDGPDRGHRNGAEWDAAGSRRDPFAEPSDAEGREANPFGGPAPTENVRTGRIRIDDGEDPGPDGGEASPDPTTVFAAVAPARLDAAEEPAVPLEEYTARRRAAEQAAASAEQEASSAAERASAAIAAAARAAEEAEAAAEIAAEAAEKATQAADAEARAIAEAAARGVEPERQEAQAEAPEAPEAPEPPTQAVPLIAPARAPRRAPLRRPSGPPPRRPRAEEAGRVGGPPPAPSAPRGGPAAGRGGADGEATAVLTGLDALRDPARPRTPEQAPAEVTTVTRRRAAERAPAADDSEDPDPDYDDEPEERGLVGRLTSRPVVAAIGVGAVLVLAAIVAIFTTGEPDAAPTETAPAALSAPVEQPPPPPAPPIDPGSPKAVAFLTAMRDADIPTSASGQAEVEAADAICAQLDQGADEAQLARSVPAVLPDVTRSQASDVVEYAQKNYC